MNTFNLIDRALEVASVAHRGQVRKGTDTPYFSHPAAVAIMLARAGCPDEVVAAGILHDTVEDTNITIEDIRATFGDRVAALVEGCSEPEKGAPWEHRKTHTLQFLRTAPYEVRVVSCADKLHNLRTIADGYTALGESIWSRFKRGRAEQAWYYRGLADVLCTPRPGDPEIPFCEEFRALVDRVFAE